MSSYFYNATFAFILLLVGFALRKRRVRLHAGLMTAGMALDLSTVLILEFTKDAIATALGPELSLWQQAHVAASSVAVIIYIPVFVLGFIRLNSPSIRNLSLRTWHLRMGYCALIFRSIGFACMFSMLGRA